MQRTTISLDEALLRELRRIAFERQTSIAAIIREAVDEKVATSRRTPKSLGAGASGHSDTARRTADEPIVPRPWR